MTELSESQKEVALWNGVVDALLNHIQHHRERAVTTLDCGLSDAHFKVLHQGAKTLATFVSPLDD